MFAALPQIYPKDFADFFIGNYFRFLVDVFHKWLMQFIIQDFYKIMNELDPIYNLKVVTHRTRKAILHYH